MESTQLILTDVSYHMQMPWFHCSKNKVDVHPIPQYSVSVYSKYRENGQPMFSMFFNVKRIFIKEIKNAWKICVLEAEMSSRLRLLDHWALQNASLAKAQEQCRFHEAMHQVVVCGHCYPYAKDIYLQRLTRCV
jgi:hypothetical protein